MTFHLPYDVPSVQLYEILRPAIEKVFPITRSYICKTELHTFEQDDSVQTVINCYGMDGSEGPDMTITDLVPGSTYVVVECENFQFVLTGTDSQYKVIRVSCKTRIGKSFSFYEWGLSNPKSIHQRIDQMLVNSIHSV